MLMRIQKHLNSQVSQFNDHVQSQKVGENLAKDHLVKFSASPDQYQNRPCQDSNLLIRSQAPYPLGHRTTYIAYHLHASPIELCVMLGQRVRDPLSLLYPSPSGDCL